MRRYRDAFRSGQPIEIDDDAVSDLNLHQVAQSRSYLYAATDAFDFARELLHQHPELRIVETQVAMGVMGLDLRPGGECLREHIWSSLNLRSLHARN